MKIFLSTIVACFACSACFSMDTVEQLYGTPKVTSLVSETERNETVRYLVVNGSVAADSWRKLRLYENLECLSLLHLNQHSFSDGNAWRFFFEAIRALPIKILDLSNQFMIDDFLKYIPSTVNFLNLSNTYVTGPGLKDLAGRKMTIQITGTRIESGDFVGTNLVMKK